MDCWDCKVRSSPSAEAQVKEGEYWRRCFVINATYFMVGNTGGLGPLKFRLRNLDPYSIDSTKQLIVLID